MRFSMGRATTWTLTATTTVPPRRNMRFSMWCAAWLCLAAWLAGMDQRPARAEAAELSVEQQAALLQRVTVTVRVTLSEHEADAVEAAVNEQTGDSTQAGNAPATAADPSAADDSVPVKAGRVSVCSGVLLGDGLIVSSFYAGSDSRIRITLPGGRQAAARLRVIDGYSGLVLLEMEQRELDGIEAADELPAVGRQVLMAAAWGAQDPVVSRGIVSGVDRTLSGVSFPPLIQCDMRSAETASGAGLVDHLGKLLGIVVLADEPDRRRGWTYAVPATHVHRLLRAHASQLRHTSPGGQPSPGAQPSPGGQTEAKTAADSILVMKRRRPVVGMVLGGEPDQVVVRRVEPDSPAARAGVRVGDQILAAEGVQIRSVYQAVRPVLFKQPGDVMRYVVQRGEQVRNVAVKLGGGVELPSATLENLGQYVRPKIDVEGLAKGRYRARSGRGEVREVFAGDPEQSAAETDPRLVTNADKLRLLERALEAYRNVIAYQQQELGRHAKERKQLEEQVRALEARLKANGDPAPGS